MFVEDIIINKGDMKMTTPNRAAMYHGTDEASFLRFREVFFPEPESEHSSVMAGLCHANWLVQLNYFLEIVRNELNRYIPNGVSSWSRFVHTWIKVECFSTNKKSTDNVRLMLLGMLLYERMHGEYKKEG
jgi:hypothetical protein